ncbi:MAG: PDZ domain-containing protein, partial [Pseudomonadota bacterium]
MKTSIITIMILWVMGFATQAFAQSDNTQKYNLDLMEAFGAAYEEIRRNYVTPVDDEELIRAAIDGMMGMLDPHSSYLPPESLKALNTSSRGEFGGLGIEVSLNEEGNILVISPIDDTPASRAGILTNDQITALDGTAVQGKSLREAVDLMRGKIGEPIVLTILRADQDPFDVTIVRDRIVLRSVRGEVIDNVGYVR